MYNATIIIKLKKGVLNPEGNTIKRALAHLGYDMVKEAKTFKCIELVIDEPNEEKAYKLVEEMCIKLLSNPVIHNYEIKLEKIDK